MQDLENEFGPTSWSINNKTSVYIVTLILAIAGVFSYINLGKEKFPDIVIPRIIVSVVYPGTSPTDMENLVTRQVEKQLKSVNGVKTINSTSNQDYAIVDVEFNSDVDVPYAKQLVKDAVDKARTDLPNDLPSPPSVTEVNLSEQPIMNINLAGDLPVQTLKKYADDIQDRIEALPEISRVDIIGALEQQVNIDVDLPRMTAAHLTFDDISGAISRENVTLSGGSIKVGNQKRAVRVAGQYAKAENMANIFITNADGSSIRLGDIATVVDGFQDRESYARLDGTPAITLNVVKRAGENLIDASDKIHALLDEGIALPKELKVTITGDSSEDTRVNLHDLINTIIIGFLLVTVILMFFMGTVNAMFVGLSVPLSMFLAFVLLPTFDFSLNMIVLFSFLLALGLVVDDAIVVIENTHRIVHEHPELSTAQAAKFAAGEVFIPVLAGTLTTVAPFVPLMFWPGLVGSFMFYLPVTLIITLMASLLIAFIINPVFAATFMQREDAHDIENRPKMTRGFLITMGVLGAVAALGYLFGSMFTGNLTVALMVFIALDRFVFVHWIAGFQTKVLPAFQNGYQRVVRWALNHTILVMSSIVVILGVSVVAIMARNPQVEFFPSGDPKFVYSYLRMPFGTDVATTDSVTQLLEKRIAAVVGQDNPDVESIITNVAIGAGDPAEASVSGTSQSHLGKVTVAFKELSERTGPATSQYLDKIRDAVKDIPGTEISVDKESSGPATGKAVAIEVAGDDYVQLAALSKQVERYVDSLRIGGIEDLRSDLVDANPEIAVNVDRERANREGVNTTQIGSLVRTAIFGREASKFKTADDDYPVQVRYAEPYRSDIDALMDAPVTFRNNKGLLRQVPISSLADLEYSTTFGAIRRKNLKKVIVISSNVLSGYTDTEVAGEVAQALKNFPTPRGYEVRMGGSQEDQQETTNFLGLAAVGAIGLIFLILVTQFNSVSKPVLILSEIIFSIAGVLLGFALTGMKISIVMTGVGAIALAGVVVKNGILLVEFTDILRSQGMPLREAIVLAGRTRLNPVILTAVAATLGLIPLAVGLNIDFYELFNSFSPNIYIGGESVVFWGPLAWTMIFGLLFATVVTLVVVPVMYLLNEKLQAKISGIDPDAHARRPGMEPAADEEEIEAATPAIFAQV